MMQIAAIVTQPPSGRDRGRKVMPSPVAQHALDRGFSSDLIFTPMKAGEVNYVLQVFWYLLTCSVQLFFSLSLIGDSFIYMNLVLHVYCVQLQRGICNMTYQSQLGRSLLVNLLAVYRHYHLILVC